jgi:LytS/YehU family sensor histidine kinase
MIPFYVVLLYLIPIFGEKKEYFTFIFLFFLSVVVSFLIGVILFKYLDAPKGDNSAEIPDLQTFFFFLNCGIITLPSAFAFIYVEKNKREIEVQRQIEQKNFLLEQAIIDTQINNLKNQINPDFLFRKLDYFYKESLPYSANLSKGISLLKEMMKYAIDDDGKNGKVSLQKEIRHIQNFIEINQLRFDGRLQIFFEASGVSEKHQIMPLVLITFVENAFKYGELLDKNSPVTINLEMRNDEMFFSTFNKIRLGPTEESEGIGIANTEKRLSLVYLNNYWLNIHHQHPHYEMKLYLNLAYSE